MKKLFLLAAIAVFGLSNVNAQDVQFGVRGSVNYALLSTSDYNSSTSGSVTTTTPRGKLGFTVGALADLTISEKFHLQPELVYSLEGDSDNDLTFINLPINAKFYFFEGFHAMVGPQLGYLISAKDSNGDDWDGDVFETKKFHIGINAGVGYDFTEKLFADLRFGYDFIDVVKGDNSFAGFSDSPVGKSYGIRLGFGYKF